jgi:hypothetical protein
VRDETEKVRVCFFAPSAQDVLEADYLACVFALLLASGSAVEPLIIQP